MIIAQRDSEGKGGNIYIDPSVTKIDATLIADGALMNGVAQDNGTVQPRNWISNLDDLSGAHYSATITPNPISGPLVINGRLLTYNTRGGSLTTAGGVFSPVHTITNPLGSDTGYCYKDGSIKDCKWDDAAAQDLERFRFATDADTINTCSLYVTGNLPENRPEILTTVVR